MNTSSHFTTDCMLSIEHTLVPFENELSSVGWLVPTVQAKGTPRRAASYFQGHILLPMANCCKSKPNTCRSHGSQTSPQLKCRTPFETERITADSLACDVSEWAKRSQSRTPLPNENKLKTFITKKLANQTKKSAVIWLAAGSPSSEFEGGFPPATERSILLRGNVGSQKHW